MFFSERLSLGEFKKHVEMSREQKRASDSGALGIPVVDRPVTKFRSRPSKKRIARKRKDDLNRLYGLSIIQSCERIHANDRCLLSSANDGEGRCVLYG